jgi:hypothetical protein
MCKHADGVHSCRVCGAEALRHKVLLRLQIGAGRQCLAGRERPLDERHPRIPALSKKDSQTYNMDERRPRIPALSKTDRHTTWMSVTHAFQPEQKGGV